MVFTRTMAGGGELASQIPALNRKHSACLQKIYKHWKLSWTEESNFALPIEFVEELHLQEHIETVIYPVFLTLP